MLSLGLKIYRLSPHHPLEASGRTHFLDHRQLHFSRGFLPGHNFKRQGQQGISGQSCHPRPVNLVIGELAPAVVVIVHGRKIIMNQRIGMYHLNGAGAGDKVFTLCPGSISSCHQQNWPEPFSPGHETVLHSLCQGFIQGFSRLVQLPGKLSLHQLPPLVPFSLNFLKCILCHYNPTNLYSKP